MSNALATRSSTTAATYGGRNPFTQFGEDVGATQSTYMKMNGNTGEYSFGKDGEEIPVGTRLAANMESLRNGWICWKDSKVVEEILVKVVDGERPPRENELTDHGPYSDDPNDGEGWHQETALDFKSTVDGMTFIYKTTGIAASRAIGQLAKDFGRQMTMHPGEVPIVELGVGSYMPKDRKKGKKYYPILKIVGWVSHEELQALESASSEAAADEGDGRDDASNYDADPTPTANKAVEQKPQESAREPEPEAEADAAPAPRKAPPANGRTRRF